MLLLPGSINPTLYHSRSLCVPEQRDWISVPVPHGKAVAFTCFPGLMAIKLDTGTPRI